MERRAFLKSTGIAGGLLTALPLSRSFGAPADNEFPLLDLHVHLTGNFTIDHVMEISKKTNVQFGIMVNPGGDVNDDAGLRRFIESLKPYTGLPWSTADESRMVQEFFAGNNKATGLRSDGCPDHSQRQWLRRHTAHLEFRHVCG